jgi:hypothetical protein
MDAEDSPFRLYTTSHLWSPWMYAKDEDGSMKLVIEDAGEVVTYNDVSKLYAPNKFVHFALIEEETTDRIVMLNPSLRK